MSLRALKVMVTRAVTSDQFRRGMLNGCRAELISEYDLDPDEQAAIMAIQAKTESEFYGAMDRIIISRETRRPSLLTGPLVGMGQHREAFSRHTARLSVSV